jgi:DNA-binding MarR family transcriptional regulator
MKNLSILELFILSCIDRGYGTPYAMQREAGLSLGATSPTLPKLAKQGLVRRETGRTATNRPKHEYALTATGKEKARQGWKAYLESDAKPPADLDALLRLVDMAQHYGAEPAQLAVLMKDAAVARGQLAKKYSLDFSETKAKAVFGYRNIRAKLDALRYKAEADGLASLAENLGHKRLSRKINKSA